MLRGPGEVDTVAWSQVRPYADPALRAKAVTLAVAFRMHAAGMVGFCSSCKAELALFAVYKKLGDDGRPVQRAVWDMRRVNLLFRKPPFISMASPSVLGELDLTEEVTRGRVLFTFQGDVPDFFYRLRTPPLLWPFMVLPGITA